MNSVILKICSLFKPFYTVLLALLHISFSNCIISRSHAGTSNQASDSEITSQIPGFSTIAGNRTDSSNGSNVVLVCFDVDGTIVHEHAHNLLSKQFSIPVSSDNGLWVIFKNKIQLTNNRQYCKQDIKDIIQKTTNLFNNRQLTLRDPERLKHIIDRLLAQKHKIAITTFSGYPDSIKVLLEKLGFNKDQIKNIPIIGGFPQGGVYDPNCKMEHIKKAMELTGIAHHFNVVLVDDNEDNIGVAKQNCVIGVHVDHNFSWLKVEKEVDHYVNSFDWSSNVLGV
ncbi:MAG: HAD family hydrolase [Candidatus Cardinium sp.]|uniref:hypothetical protein n=1 Tax=Cardinium endosymbiont of Dermatophagoides farinae TaxID=2597823 RepID=UPI001182D128|nr:hypothetical protein [Cardinium endosymbiont of Dermatophagoides farinae]TSJ81059.1 hypothetical protein FPG78_03470 [Cardinium endosymbiont of Dermatophagoides farinae]UWW97087.1 MAG: HAD family hydrolase [Candidatus Cardinium sp.]